MKPKVLIIVGPTASGKSELGVELAHRFNGEVISADSRQVYRGLDIGTGKITKREMRGVPHHLLDVASPKRAFSAGDYMKRATKAIEDISARGKLPIIVGGTGFYIDALVGRIPLPEVPANLQLRKRLTSKSAHRLYAMLKKIDPARAKAMSTPSERNNKLRLIRAIEIAKANAKTPKVELRSPSYDALWIGVRPSDADLKKRIGKRLSERIKSGMQSEAKRLHKAGVSFKRMRELGLEYRSLARCLQKEITSKEMEAELQSDIWRYARKQIGYWKRNANIQWFKPDSKKVSPAVSRWLRR